MDAKTKQQYLADSPPTVVRLEIKPHWERLKDERSRKYAHFLSRSVLSQIHIQYFYSSVLVSAIALFV